jgi:peroxin-19
LFQYPAWLEENRSNLESSEFERFSKQKELMDQVCVELEKESESDSQEEKKRRFDTILDLMQKVRFK